MAASWTALSGTSEAWAPESSRLCAEDESPLLTEAEDYLSPETDDPTTWSPASGAVETWMPV